ncbi:MAG: hypothetical protein ACYTGB_15095 [Planctomycetota bacterium]
MTLLALMTWPVGAGRGGAVGHQGWDGGSETFAGGVAAAGWTSGGGAAPSLPAGVAGAGLSTRRMTSAYFMRVR